MKLNNTIKLFLVTLLFQVPQQLTAQENELEWVSASGGTGTNEVARAITVDNNGNVYTTGRFSGTSDFDPGSGVFTMTSSGNADAFIQKLDNTGNLVWAKQIGGSTGADQGYTITSDETGIYIGGTFKSTTDFDPGTGTFTMTHSGSGFDGFILKLDLDGNFIWARQFGGSSNDAPNEFVIDNNGDLLATGYFNGTATFGSTTLTTSGSSAPFVLKMDSDGNQIWAKAMSTTSQARGMGITSDNDLGVYITGWFEGTIDLDPGTNNETNTSVGGRDIFMCKLDDTGDFLWGYGMGSPELDQGKSLTVNSLGDIYLIGQFSETTDFHPGNSTLNLTSAGATDCFVKKMKSNGDLVWARRFGGANGDFATKILADPNDDIYLSGVFQGNTDFDLDSSEFILSSNGVQDFFIEKLDIDGDLIWVQGIGNTGNDQSFDASLDADGNIYACGHYENSVDFDFSTNDMILTSFGERDAFALKLEASCIQPDNTVEVNDFTLSANANNVEYQWINCFTYTPINGETSQSFTPSENGDYAVIVTHDNCSDTSDCTSITTLGTPEVLTVGFSIYPNPSSDQITVQIEQPFHNGLLEVISTTGVTLLEQHVTENIHKSIDIKHLPEGIYFLQITTDNGKKGIQRFQKVR